MDDIIQCLLQGKTPFSIIQKQDSDTLLLLIGEAEQFSNLNDIPRKKNSTSGKFIYDTINVVPFCQIRERGFEVQRGEEEILTICVTKQLEIDTEFASSLLPNLEIKLATDLAYDLNDEDYCNIIEKIVQEEIGNGEGANFVVPRTGKGQIDSFTVSKALAIFNSLLKTDYGTYWKFIFYDTKRYFIGSTPERHLHVQGNRVKMNPISGTFRKDILWEKDKDFKADLLGFLTDQKEINELFMVVDEELKMMAKMCGKGGTIIGPLLKEMSQLIHTEYLLSGTSDKDVIELFRESMFAATVVGSPVENACNIINKHSQSSRGYYGSALMLLGRDEQGEDILDSPITIRTLEIDLEGNFNFSVGATLVRDSIATSELQETQAKSRALLACLGNQKKKQVRPPMLPRFYNDDEIVETLVQRNQSLSHFWFFRQNHCSQPAILETQKAINITLIHNEDDFIYMLQHMLHCLNYNTSVLRFDDYHLDSDTSDITVVGPGPGNPSNTDDNKINRLYEITNNLLQRKKKALFICLGHQLLCKCLGFNIKRKQDPTQGCQEEIDLFGQKELVGFYNTFVPCAPLDYNSPPAPSQYELALGSSIEEIVGIRSKLFIGFQFHPESVLTQNGYTIVQQAIQHLLSLDMSHI